MPDPKEMKVVEFERYHVELIVEDDGTLVVRGYRKNLLGDHYFVPLGFVLGSNMMRMEPKDVTS